MGAVWTPVAMCWRCIVWVSAALSMMLTLGGDLVAPDGCWVVAAWENGDAVAACADGETWFVYDPDLTRDGMWSLARSEPPALAALAADQDEVMSAVLAQGDGTHERIVE
jgi:hypothetical protein